MGLDLQAREYYSELEKHPNKDEIIALLWVDFSDFLLDSISNSGKKVTIKQLEKRLSYNINTLFDAEKLIFYYKKQPVWYIKIEFEENNIINLHTFITSNNNNPCREIILPEYIDSSKDNKSLIIWKKLPYLGTTILKILIEQFCIREGIERINIVAIEWADKFYEKTLEYLWTEWIIEYYEQDGNSFEIYLNSI